MHATPSTARALCDSAQRHAADVAPRLAGVQDIVLCLRSGVYHSHGPSPCPFEVVPPGARSSNSGVTMCALTDVVLCVGTDDAGPEMEHDDDGNVVTGAHTGGYAQRMYAAPEDAARTALGAESTGKVSAAMRRQTRETASRASKRVQVAAPRAAETPYALATSVLNSAGAYAASSPTDGAPRSSHPPTTRRYPRRSRTACATTTAPSFTRMSSGRVWHASGLHRRPTRVPGSRGVCMSRPKGWQPRRAPVAFFLRV